MSIDHSIAKVGAFYVLTHVDFEVRILDAIATQHFAQVERQALAAAPCRVVVSIAGRRTHEWEIEICKLELSIVRVDFVDQQGNVLVLLVALYRVP